MSESDDRTPAPETPDQEAPDREGPDLETLARMQRDFGGHSWGEAELAELTNPQRGIITGFAELLRDLKAIRARPLPALPATVLTAPEDTRGDG